MNGKSLNGEVEEGSTWVRGPSRSRRRQPTTSYAHQLKLGPSSCTSTSSLTSSSSSTSSPSPTTSCAHQLKLGPSSFTSFTTSSTTSSTSSTSATTSYPHQLKLGPSSYTSTSSANLILAAQRKLDINSNQTFDIIL